MRHMISPIAVNAVVKTVFRFHLEVFIFWIYFQRVV
jgi:hypothetical protein